VRHEVNVVEVPPSGEVIRGRKKVREFPKAYPTRDLSACAGCWSGKGYGLSRGATTTAVGGCSTWC
jgi:hypothetical protein